MAGKLLLGFTSLAYAALITINLYKPIGTGDQFVGWRFVVLAVLAAFGIFSLILTLILAYDGKFEWISKPPFTRKLIIGAGWLLFMTGIVYITFINSDWHDSRSANWLGLIMIHYGALWVPLLMLMPYFILLNPKWYNSLSPNMYRIPLSTGCIIGMAFLFLNNNQLSNLFTDQKALANIQYEEALKDIESGSVERLLYYMYEGTDARLTQAALTKLKNKENLDAALINILNRCESDGDYLSVFTYLENNNVEQPELFIKPLNHAISVVATELKYSPQSFGVENEFLGMLNVDGICHILDKQFKAYRVNFRPNMLRIKKELDKEPKAGFIEIRNKYKAAVDEWLASQ